MECLQCRIPHHSPQTTTPDAKKPGSNSVATTDSGKSTIRAKAGINANEITYQVILARQMKSRRRCAAIPLGPLNIADKTSADRIGPANMGRKITPYKRSNSLPCLEMHLGKMIARTPPQDLREENVKKAPTGCRATKKISTCDFPDQTEVGSIVYLAWIK